jgi:glycosyltransferase involved in cell wall biosynthesis
MPDLYAIADVAILPSMCEEGAGLTIIEAMAGGLPVITTQAGGIPEYANEKCAFILKRDENLVENIAQSIDTLLSNDSLREKMGKESLLAVKDLNLDNYYFNLLSLLEK